MNVLKRLAIKNLKMNKKRTVSTIIGIILSTALICGTATLVTSFQKTLIQNAINDIDEENEKELNNNRDIKSMYEVKDIGYGLLNRKQKCFETLYKTLFYG